MKEARKTVVICGGDNIISASIQNTLEIHADWDVIHLPSTQELEELLQSNSICQPAVVIFVHQESHFCFSNNHLKLLQERSDVKLVAISLENNLMEVYNKQNVLIRQASDFTHVIQEEANPCQELIRARNLSNKEEYL